MTSSNGSIFRVTGLLCGELFSAQRPVTRSLDVFFHLRLNKRLSKQSSGWWFETPPRPLWRHCIMFCDWEQNIPGEWCQYHANTMLMPWTFASLAHQQPLYWQAFRVNGPISSMGKYFNYMRHLSVDKWQKMQMQFFIFSQINLLHRWLIQQGTLV